MHRVLPGLRPRADPLCRVSDGIFNVCRKQEHFWRLCGFGLSGDLT